MTWARETIASFGDIARFMARVMGEVYSGRVLRFFGEALRQAGILILGSALVIWGLAFILGLTCGIEGAYFSRSVGAPAQAGVFSAWCDLREVMPYAFGYMMSAKVGTGLVAEIGAMRISDEVDALEVMGISSLTFLCSTRLLAAWIVLPFIYIAAVGAGFFASYLAVVQQIGEVSSGGLLPHLLDVPEPTRPALQPREGHGDGDGDRAGGLLLRLHGEGRPGRGGHRDGQVDGAEHRDGAPGGHGGHADLLGLEPKGADRWLSSLHAPAARPSGSRRRTSARPGARCATRSRGSRTSCPACSPRRGIASSREPSVPASGGPRLLTLGQLEALRDDLAERLDEARRALAERTLVEEGYREQIEEMLLDPAEHRWMRVSNADIGEPGCKSFHVRPRAGFLGMFASWWRVVISSGCPLPLKGGQTCPPLQPPERRFAPS